MSKPVSHHLDERIDSIMATLLRTGVLLAAGLVTIGGVIFLVRHPMPATNYRVFQGEPAELRTISGIFREAVHFSGRTIAADRYPGRPRALFRVRVYLRKRLDVCAGYPYGSGAAKL